MLEWVKKINGWKILAHAIVFSLLVVLLGKVLVNQHPSNILLFIYGVGVTGTVLVSFFYAFVVYEDPHLKAKRLPNTRHSKTLVSILVSVFNEEDVITRCIESLVSQTYPNFEVIIVNDASTDRTLKVLRPWAMSGRIKLIDLKNNIGKKKALAEAMLIARGEVFAFSDSDSVLAPDAIEKIMTIFNMDPEVGAVSGHCRALNADASLLTRIQDSWYEGQFSVRKAFESCFGSVTCVSGPLAVFRKEAIFNFIPAWQFDSFLGEEFKFATDRTLTGFVLGCEFVGQDLKQKYADSKFVKEKDYPIKHWKILYCKSARVWTVVPDSLRRVLKQQIRWKKSFIRNIFFTGKFFWKKPLVPALVYYAHILFVFAGPFIVFRHLIFLPTTGNFTTGVLYLLGIVFVGFCFGLAYKLENPESHKWIYRPLMSLFSTLVLCWLIFYSMVTIRKKIWSRA